MACYRHGIQDRRCRGKAVRAVRAEAARSSGGKGHWAAIGRIPGPGLVGRRQETAQQVRGGSCGLAAVRKPVPNDRRHHTSHRRIRRTSRFATALAEYGGTVESNFTTVKTPPGKTNNTRLTRLADG